MNRPSLIAICFFLSGFALLARASECPPSCQEAAVEQYFERLNQVYKKGSTEADIDSLFELFHDNVRYQHLEYGADFNRTDWDQAFKGNLERGAYQGASNDDIKVTNRIFGKNHVAVEYMYGTVDKEGKWKPKDGQGLFALFGFEGNKIVLVREYW